MKNIVLLVTIVLGISLSASAQAQMAKFYFDKGKTLYQDKEYDEAISELEKALEKDESYQDAYCYLGYAYYDKKEYSKAINAFNKLQGLDDGTYWGWYLYIKGQSNFILENWKEAEKDFAAFLKQYTKTDPSKSNFLHRGTNRLEYAKNVAKVRNNKGSMPKPINLGNTVNTISDDMMPQINPSGNRMYFTSERKGGFDNFEEENDYGQDLYYTEYSASGWGKPQLLPAPINTNGNDGTSTFSADGQQMVYVKCGEENSVGGCDLFTSTLNGSSWTIPKNLGNVLNSEDWDSQPSLSADGNTLYFVTSREGTYDGSMDIYVTKKDKYGLWGPPQNLGGVINTPFGEKSPYIAPDGKTLYFSSEGHAGYGEYDIFVSVLEDGKWSTPINLGAPLNSAGRDTYFTISASGEEAFFASDRDGDNLDIYSVKIPEALRPKPSVIVKGVVTNAKNNAKIDAWILVEDLTTGELIATTKSNSVSGEYLVVLPSGKNYSVSANKEGFFFYSNSFNVPNESKYEEFVKNINLKPIEKGARVVLNNIFFETGKADLTQESYIELGKAIDLMKANKKMVVEVGGHTDNVGADESNMKLSHNRAKSVRDYLVKAGISSDRLQAKGYGETQPVASNDTEEGRKANRRTEFVILEN